MAAKFEIHTPKAGEYRWVLVSQGRTLATSPAYSRRGLAEKAIVSFRMAAIAAPVADLTRPAAKTAPAKVARTAGRLVGKSVVKSGRAVEKVEKAAAKATTKAAKAVKKTAAKATKATKKATTKKSAMTRKRASRAR